MESTMSQVKQIDIITDLLIDFDEMGFAPTTACPDPEAYAKEWRQKITEALEKFCKQSEGEWIHEAPYTTFSGEYLKGSECSVCHSFFVSKGNEPWSDHPFCCECGAKMKGGEG